MQSELKSLQREVGITFLFVTHDQEEAMALSDRIALLRNGALEQVAAPREIYAHPATAYTAQFIGQTNLLRATVQNGIGDVRLADVANVRGRRRGDFFASPGSDPDRAGRFAGFRAILSASERRSISRFTAARANCSKSNVAPDRLLRARIPARDPLAAQQEFSFLRERCRASEGLDEAPTMYSRAYKTLSPLPPLLWVGLFLLLPYALMFAHSFWLVRDGFLVHEWNLQNYHKLVSNPLYVQVLLRTMRIAASVTLLSLLLGYPLAYFLSFHAGARKELLYQLVIVPLWVSYLVRGYAWKTILGSDGVLNGFLQYLHITHEPVGFLLYSPFAVIVMLTHIYTPFVFLPIYASLEHIPRPLIEASHDLGANRRTTFLRVILPLSMPGLLAGATFAFVLSLGDFLAPLLVGGPSGTMIANIVQSLFGAAYDWPLGAAISVCILIITITLLSLTERFEKRWSFK